MSQRTLQQGLTESKEDQTGHRIQFETVSIDLQLLDASMKANLVSVLSKKVFELCKITEKTFDYDQLLSGDADAKIVRLAKALEDLEDIDRRRNQIQESLMQELSAETQELPASEIKKNPKTPKQGHTASGQADLAKADAGNQALPTKKTSKVATKKRRSLESTQKEPVRKEFNESAKRPVLKSHPKAEKAAPAAKDKPPSKVSLKAKLHSVFKPLLEKKTTAALNKAQPASATPNRLATQASNTSLPKNIVPPPPEDDVELEEGNFFSLEKHYLESLRRRPQIVRKDAVIDVEVAVLKDMNLQDIHLVCVGKKFKLKLKWLPETIVSVDKRGRHTVRVPKKGVKAVLHQGSQVTALPPQQIIELKLGEWVDLRTDSLHYLIRPVMAPKDRPYQVIEEDKIDWRVTYGGSFLGHFAIIALIALIGFINKPAEEPPEQEFVQISLNELVDIPKPEPVKPEPKPEPKLEPVAVTEPVEEKPVQPAQQAIAEKPAPAPKKTEPPKNVGGGNKDGGNIVQRDVKATGLLAALGSTTAAKPSSANALAQVTNLDAIESPSADGGLKVAGLSAAVDGVRTTVPSGELVTTRGSDGVLRSGGIAGDGNIAALEQGEAGNGQVRGSVSAQLSKQVKVQGGISRAAVKRVIDAHLSEVTFCYESALAYDPNLAGKIVFEWTILTTGRVGNVGIQSSTVQSTSLHNCIRSAIRSWQFPRPKGTDVVVSYPFVFDMVGF